MKCIRFFAPKVGREHVGTQRSIAEHLGTLRVAASKVVGGKSGELCEMVELCSCHDQVPVGWSGLRRRLGESVRPKMGALKTDSELKPGGEAGNGPDPLSEPQGCVMGAIPTESLEPPSTGSDGQVSQRHEEDPDKRGAQRLVPIKAAAEYLDVSRATVERLVSRGQLPVVKDGAATPATLRISMNPLR